MAGARFRTITRDGRDAIDGVIEEMSPPAPGQPGRFVQTWHVLYDAAMAEEPPSRVEWTIEQVGERLTRVRLVHGDLAGSPLTWANVKDGWVWVLDALKTVLETGRTLPGIDDDLDTTPPPHPPTATGTVGRASRPTTPRWPCSTSLATRPPTRSCSGWRTPRRTTGSARQAAPPANDARAAYVVSRALTATDQPARGLVSADRCLAICLDHGIVDFDLAYANEARARALHAPRPRRRGRCRLAGRSLGRRRRPRGPRRRRGRLRHPHPRCLG